MRMKKRKTAVFACVIVLFFCAILLGLCWGSYEISVHEVIATLLGNGTKIQNTAIFGIRLPRILLGIFVAAGLAISGGVLQTMTRNELADPGIIGINAGGATAAVLFIQFQTNAYFSELGTFSIYLLPLMAISGALAAAFALYGLSKSFDAQVISQYQSYGYDLVGLGTNGYADTSAFLKINVWGAFVTELLLTFVFVLAFLCVTAKTAYKNVAGLVWHFAWQNCLDWYLQAQESIRQKALVQPL